jgi:hypothetical protein
MPSRELIGEIEYRIQNSEYRIQNKGVPSTARMLSVGGLQSLKAIFSEVHMIRYADVSVFEFPKQKF